jgi:hypothetical protein
VLKRLATSADKAFEEAQPSLKNYIKKVLKKTPLALKERGVKLG